MERHIAIIDPDPIFSRYISRRLQHMIPLASVHVYSPEEIESDASMTLTEEVILYDESRTDLHALQTHMAGTVQQKAISLQTHGTENRRNLTGTELRRRVMESPGSTLELPVQRLPDMIVKPPFLFDTGSDSAGVGRDRGHVRIFVSFAGRTDRECYIARNMTGILSSGKRVIRLDLMSGVEMTNPFQYRSKSTFGNREIHAAGISDLLLRLENTEMKPAEILEYVQIGKDGCFYFGLPTRSDDIICSQPRILIRLLHLLRQLADDENAKTMVLVAMESIPFRILKQICPIAHELHVLLPSDEKMDDTLCKWEINDLFSSLPPTMLTFVSSGRGPV